MPVNYALDLNAGPTQVLEDGTNTYLYGLERLAQNPGTGDEYFLGDALGSVRQLADASGEVTLARAYEPYGSVAGLAGTASSSYGFTGEAQDATGLVYLRARYYAPASGQFVQADDFVPNPRTPADWNRHFYTRANPASFTDPSGHYISPSDPRVCMMAVFSYGVLPPSTSAKQLVELCRQFYSPATWREFGVAGIGPFDCEETGIWSKPTTPGELFRDYLCELGWDEVEFTGQDILTRQLARSLVLHKIRTKFYKNGGADLPRFEQRFGDPAAYAEEYIDLRVDTGFPLAHVLGSFFVSVNRLSNGRIKIAADNSTNLASGTHFVGRFPPPGEESTPFSLEKYIDDHRQQAQWSAAFLINSHPEIKSILQRRLRTQTEAGSGGGELVQKFTWTEADLGCEFYNEGWPAYLSSLAIGN